MSVASDAIAAYETRLASFPGTHALLPRWAEPGWEVRTHLTTTPDFSAVHLWADANGVVVIESPEQHRLADALGLAVIDAADEAAPALPAIAGELAALNAAGSDGVIARRDGWPDVLVER